MMPGVLFVVAAIDASWPGCEARAAPARVGLACRIPCALPRPEHLSYWQSPRAADLTTPRFRCSWRPCADRLAAGKAADRQQVANTKAARILQASSACNPRTVLVS